MTLNNTTILNGVIVSIVLIGGMGTAFAQTNQTVADPFDEIMNQVEIVYQELQSLENNPIQNSTAINAKQSEYDALMEQAYELAGYTPCEFELTDEQEVRRQNALDRLKDSRYDGDLQFPYVSFGPNCNRIDIEIYNGPPIEGMFVVDRNIDADIMAFLGDDVKGIPVNITYVSEIPQAQLHTSVCDSTTKKCDPLIGGALGQNDAGGPCTVSLADQRQFFLWIQSGIVIPKHCMHAVELFYQYDNISGHLVGDVTVRGGSNCDCAFIESDVENAIGETTRSIDSTKIYTGGNNDLTISGKSNAVQGQVVRLYGGVTGLEWGMVTLADKSVMKRIGDGSMMIWDNAYIVSGIAFTNGDSGAPIISFPQNHYVGMHVSGEQLPNNPRNHDSIPRESYGHTYDYLKSQLGLR